MKIAVISDDGATVSQHFGRAPLYVVVTVEDGKVLSKESRAKAGHHTFATGETHEQHGPGHGFDADSQNKHVTMASTIGDCQVLLAGGMGMGAYQSLKGLGVETIITEIEGVDAAVEAYLSGSIQNRLDYLH